MFFCIFFFRDFSFSRLKVINWEPTEEFVKSSHMVNNAMQTMQIMGDLGPAGRSGTHSPLRYTNVLVYNSDLTEVKSWSLVRVHVCDFLRLGQKENECLLVTIKTDGSGTVVIKPDFNKDKEPYRQVEDV